MATGVNYENSLGSFTENDIQTNNFDLTYKCNTEYNKFDQIPIPKTTWGCMQQQHSIQMFTQKYK
jgi:hypothetical protein